MVVKRLGAGIETGELRGQRVGELDKARILLGSQGFAYKKEDNGDEDDDLEDKDEDWHFDFPSPLRIAPCWCEFSYVDGSVDILLTRSSLALHPRTEGNEFSSTVEVVHAEGW
jgi:hypothetical protein